MGKEEDDVKIGDLVWAKVSGYPWWPATVSRNVKQKMWKKGGKIWVNFFNDSQSAWIPVKNNLLPFNAINTTTVMEKIKPTHRSYDMIKEAIEEAAEVQKKQAANAMEVTVADPDDILAIAEGRVATKRGAEEKEEDGPAAKKPKKSLRGDAVDKEEPKKPRRRSTKAKIQAEDAATESSEDEIMEEVEKSTPKKMVKIKSSNDDKVQRLEKQVSTLKSEIKRLKEELKLSRSTRRNEYSAYVPPAPPMTEFSISTNPCSLPVTKTELSEELKLLKQYGHAYDEKSDAAAEHRKTAGELASKFNARIRAMSNSENAARKCEEDVLDSLSKLLAWSVTVEMLKECQAGRPVRKVDARSGKRSPAVAGLCKQLRTQWVALLDKDKQSADEEKSAVGEKKDEEVSPKSQGGDGSKSPEKAADGEVEERTSASADQSADPTSTKAEDLSQASTKLESQLTETQRSGTGRSPVGADGDKEEQEQPANDKRLTTTVDTEGNKQATAIGAES
eukprot:CAMPEP_0113967470 /NCGR_PEP_ID=MMETSP0011_2-20120614/8952_1 /TAXON_ID=101924 /ORGANISM="Rhodosorus marinus" /LENGTH=504 /DNA_ID=CAMNT_0000980365 /DNA_START=252 /DNA_END=1766 /DNA_ORIENTATION=+ /assembly_acc=CAM_ASM_000156